MSVNYELLSRIFPPTMADYFTAFMTLLLLIAILIVPALIYGVLEERYLANKTWIGIKERRWPWDLTVSESFQMVRTLLAHSENKN